MINIHLLVDESYIEELMLLLPKDKVRVVEKNFEENQVLLQDSLEAYRTGVGSFIPCKESIEQINTWLEEKQ